MKADDDKVGTPPLNGEADAYNQTESADIDASGDDETAITQPADLDSRDTRGYDAAEESAGAPAAPTEKLSAEGAEQNPDEVEAEFASIKPWREPINLADVLDDVRQTIVRFIVCEPHTATAATLWIAFTWAIDYVDQPPAPTDSDCRR